jgi:hypothetical protein
MSEHVRFSVETGVEVYFCDPKSPWQRGTNENTNGLLRQYLPKRTDLAIYNQRQLDTIAKSLNTRPQKTLGSMTHVRRSPRQLQRPPESTGDLGQPIHIVPYGGPGTLGSMERCARRYARKDMLISLMRYSGGNAAGSNGFPIVGVIVVAVLVAFFAFVL